MKTCSTSKPPTSRHTRAAAFRLGSAPLLILLILFLSAAFEHTGALRLWAQSRPPVEYERYDVDIQLEDDGDLRVRIRQRVHFDGEFERAFLEVPKSFTDSINDIAIYLAEGDALSPANAGLTESADAVSVSWTYPRTKPGDVREFAIDYTASGALWVYNDRDILRWDAIHADRSGVPIQASRVTVRLPSYIPLDAVQAAAQGAPHAVDRLDDALVFTMQDALPDGRLFNVEIDFPHGLVNAAIRDWQKSVDTDELAVDLERLGIRIWIKKNGALVIREEMDVTVTTGVLYDAYREIKRLFLDDVTNMRVLHDDRLLSAADSPCDECLVVSSVPRDADWVRYDRSRNQIEIDELRAGYVRADWFISPVYPGQTARFAVEFAVRGAIRQDDDVQSFEWQVAPDLGVQPVAANLQICPPEGLAVRQLDVTHSLSGVSLRADAEGCLFAQSLEPLPPTELWNLRVTMPRNTVANVLPQWQADLENALDEQSSSETARARQQLALLVTAMLAIVSLVVGGVIAWFKWGRRRVREQLGGYISEPPSDLAPGIVAYLVDGAVRANSLLASLLQLAALGLIEIDLRDGLSLRLAHTGEASVKDLRSPGDSRKTAPNAHLGYLFNRVVLPASSAERFITLEELSARLQHALPEFYSLMAYDAQSYLIGSGLGRKSVLRSSPFVLMLAWFAAAATIIFATFRFRLPNGFAMFLVGATFLVFFVLHATRELGSRGAYTDLGEVERAKWIKFKNYLADLRKYGDHGAARKIMERYFAYAVALGVEEIVLAQAVHTVPRRPAWLAPPPTATQSGQSQALNQLPDAQTGAHLTPQAPSSGVRPPIVRRVHPAPGLAGMSRALGASLSQASSSLGALLNNAARSADGAPIQITLKSAGGTRSLRWEGGASVNRILDDILNQSMRDARRALAERQRANAPPRGRPAPANSPARSSGGFGVSRTISRSSSSSRSSGGSRSSSGSKPSSGSRGSGGGGRSGFS